MKIIPEPLRQWFGYTRRERRSSLILLLLIAVIYAARYLFPEQGLSVEEIDVVRELTEQAGVSPGAAYSVRGSAGGGGGAVEAESRRRVKQYKAPVGGEYKGSGAIQLKIDLNKADSALLESLPGIGPVLALRTIKYRDLLGGFVSVLQLQEVYGLSAETWELICNRVRADSSGIRKIEINEAGYAELIRHPYLERYDVTSILKYRETMGEIRGFGDIIENRLIDSTRAKKVMPYLKFR